MKNIRIIKTNVDVSGILSQLHEFPEDWGAVAKIKESESLLDRGFPHLSAGVLQLVMGGVTSIDQFVGDTEICIPTPQAKNHTEIFKFISSHFSKVSRCGFLSLPVGGFVGTHIDIGNYYLTRDRYHLSIQGRYEYTVGDEMVVVEPGTLLWFDNKLPHGTTNIGDEVRITFVFDVPHSKDNL